MTRYRLATRSVCLLSRAPQVVCCQGTGLAQRILWISRIVFGRELALRIVHVHPRCAPAHLRHSPAVRVVTVRARRAAPNLNAGLPVLAVILETIRADHLLVPRSVVSARLDHQLVRGVEIALRRRREAWIETSIRWACISPTRRRCPRGQRGLKQNRRQLVVQPLRRCLRG